MAKRLKQSAGHFRPLSYLVPDDVRMQALGGLLLLGYLIGAFGQSFPGFSGSTPSTTADATSSGPELYSYDVVDTYPHDPDAFTQGLDYDKVNGQDVFWESTGMRTSFLPPTSNI